MKIKLAILEKDTSYLNRIITVFSTKYADNFEIYSFTDAEIALNSLDNAKIDILIANDVFDIDTKKLPKRCGFAYLVDSMDVETLRGEWTICKYQKIDLIYKQILSIYSEHAGSISGLKIGEDSATLIAFMAPAGGSGSSSMAAACAIHYAKAGYKTLYLNLEEFGSADSFFSGEGQFNQSDVIFALKSQKANLALKLESSVKQDPRGVYFYSQTKIALDMMELKSQEIIRLLSEIKLTGGYEYIVVDMDFGLEDDKLNILKQTHSVVWVSDGSEISNTKFLRAFEALMTKESNAESPILSRLQVIYNKFSNKTGRMLSGIDIRDIGGAPRYEHATTAQIIDQLSGMECFDKIV